MHYFQLKPSSELSCIPISSSIDWSNEQSDMTTSFHKRIDIDVLFDEPVLSASVAIIRLLLLGGFIIEFLSGRLIDIVDLRYFQFCFEDHHSDKAASFAQRVSAFLSCYNRFDFAEMQEYKSPDGILFHSHSKIIYPLCTACFRLKQFYH
jgi:hypothetical protein